MFFGWGERQLAMPQELPTGSQESGVRMEGHHFSPTHFMFFGEPKANTLFCVLTPGFNAPTADISKCPFQGKTKAWSHGLGCLP